MWKAVFIVRPRLFLLVIVPCRLVENEPVRQKRGKVALEQDSITCFRKASVICSRRVVSKKLPLLFPETFLLFVLALFVLEEHYLFKNSFYYMKWNIIKACVNNINVRVIAPLIIQLKSPLSSLKHLQLQSKANSIFNAHSSDRLIGARLQINCIGFFLNAGAVNNIEQ